MQKYMYDFSKKKDILFEIKFTKYFDNFIQKLLKFVFF
jgi:hypothetical protein